MRSRIALAAGGVVLVCGLTAAPALAATPPIQPAAPAGATAVQAYAWGPVQWSSHKHCTTAAGTDINEQIQYRIDTTNGAVQQLGVAVYAHLFVANLAQYSENTWGFDSYTWTTNTVAQPTLVRYRAMLPLNYTNPAAHAVMWGNPVGNEVGAGTGTPISCRAAWRVSTSGVVS